MDISATVLARCTYVATKYVAKVTEFSFSTNGAGIL